MYKIVYIFVYLGASAPGVYDVPIVVVEHYSGFYEVLKQPGHLVKAKSVPSGVKTRARRRPRSAASVPSLALRLPMVAHQALAPTHSSVHTSPGGPRVRGAGSLRVCG